ncbi:beta-propeller domain-containing protein [Cohnella panacarvi]|uniref:beta-propeller domain-containing protein n=1 Tax=Cohnella panacarvi TaxID=400776 RepID=UPI00047BD58D|nr:beta-propeller domain-containing protein [Cohnella panacarvi]
MVKTTIAGMLLAGFILVASTVAAPPGKAPAKPAAAAAVDFKGSIVVNGVALKLSQPTYTVNKVTMVPLKPIAEALGAKISSGTDAEGRSYAKLTRGKSNAEITAGVARMVANDRTFKLDVAPELRNGSIMVPVRAISEALGTIVAWDGVANAIRIDDPKQLPVVGTQKKLDELMQEIRDNGGMFDMREGGIVVSDQMMMKSIPPNAAVAAPQASSVNGAASGADNADGGSGSGEGADYSKTNVQVQGVDEADWAKTDGKFVYQISGNRGLISDISNPSAPKLAATLEYKAEDHFYPTEMYVDDHRLVVIGQHNVVLPMAGESAGSGSSGSSSASGDTSTLEKKIGIMPIVPMASTVQTKIYGLDDAGIPTLKRETEIEGSYVSSRKIDGALYVVTNKYNYNYVYPMEKRKLVDSLPAQPSSGSGIEPVYGDSASAKELRKLPLSDIRYFPNAVDNSMMLIGALDLDRPEQAFQVSAYLGSGQTIYASSKHLYVSIAKPVPDGDNNYPMQTRIYKFRLDQGNVVYAGEGSVPGNALNQFSMDEHNGYFRIATTKDAWTMKGEYRSSNNLYVLDEQLKTIGKLEDLAPGERIYSARFMGGRAYMVTFRQVDPLFVLDLRSPTKPAVLGQLKIPGYSDYLHPYDDNHIIGFGKETVELPVKGADEETTMAYYQGMKIALFDVTDVNHPKEKFKEVIGDRGTSSELLYNHKALLFSKEKGLMAFPVELMEVQNKDRIEQGGFPAYGQFVYQGAYVYCIDPNKGFDLRGRITHLSQDDLAKSGQYGYNYGKSVRRILYAGDTLYTLSESMLKANDLGSLSERGTLEYPPLPGMNELYGNSAIDVVPATAAPASR